MDSDYVPNGHVTGKRNVNIFSCTYLATIVLELIIYPHGSNVFVC